MTQDELNRALEEALHVDPTAGYLARVRARVAVEQAASAGGRAWWPLGTLAAAVVVLVAGGLILEREDSSVPAATATPRAANFARDSTTQPGPQAAGDGRHSTGLAEVAVEANGLPRRGDSLPAVVTSPDDISGPRLLAKFLETEVGVATTGDDEREAPLQIGRIDVAPIEMSPLPQPTPVAIGELQ